MVGSYLMLDEQRIGIILRHVNECVMVIQQGESFKCKIVFHPALRRKTACHNVLQRI